TISNSSSAPTISAPAFLASSALSPRAKTATRTVRPVPFGRLTTPRTIWSAWRGSTPRFIAISMVSSNLATARSLTRPIAADRSYSLLRSTPSRILLMRLEIFAIVSAHHFQAHRTGRTFDHAHRCFNISGVQILHLRFSDRANLVASDRAGACLARGLRTGLEVSGLLEEVGHRRGLHHKSERLVLVIGDHDWNRRTLFHFLRGSVERLAEFHDVDAALTQGRTDRRRRIGRTCRYLELQLACNFLSHCFLPFLFCRKSGFLD